MDALKLPKPQEATSDYDQEADVLYISFGEPTSALTLDLGNGILARYLEESNTLVGLTIIGVRAMTQARTAKSV